MLQHKTSNASSRSATYNALARSTPIPSASNVVYQSENVRPGSGNAVVWNGDGDVATIAEALRAKGVKLEEYPALGMRIDRGVHTSDGFAAIWFKDPDGNVLHVNSA